MVLNDAEKCRPRRIYFQAAEIWQQKKTPGASQSASQGRVEVL
jgi:hypothetical protein